MTRPLTIHTIAPALTGTGRAAFGPRVMTKTSTGAAAGVLAYTGANAAPVADHFDRNLTPALASRGAG